MSKIVKALEMAKEARLSRSLQRQKVAEEAAIAAAAAARAGAPTAPVETTVDAPPVRRRMPGPRKKPVPLKESRAPRAGHDIVRRKSSRAVIKTMEEVEPLGREELAKRKIIYPEMENQRVLNVFRDLRTTLLTIANGSNFSCLVTSVVPKGGSSFVATNLATAFSFDDTKTSLIIDCNLNAPNPNLPISHVKVGLTEYLEDDELKASDIICPTGIPRMRAVSSGGRREIPAEYFSSDRMIEFLEEVQSRFRDRYTFLDGPSTKESADVKLLSSLCDYILLVVPYARVTTSQVEATVRTIDESKLIGVVFNNEPY